MRSIESFGIKVFNKEKMKETLPYPIYLKWKDAKRLKKYLDRESADAIAHAMKEWAISNGASHYAHWFSPLNGLTAKKYEAFLDRTDKGNPIERFSGKELIKGEPDASSFPNGGMRSTFEARGYTYWDLTANSFIIDKVLYIPSIFMSYYGEKLDRRGPLLDSCNILSEVGKDIVNLFEKTHAYRLKVKVGLEQEFFLVDKKLYDQRIDLRNIGRTLVGASAPRGQEFVDRYFGQIPQRVEKFFENVDKRLWELGIYSKTEHNENAPLQFEIACMFEDANISVDDNLLTMNILKEEALKLGMVCLLEEKPFARVNGSGKHNNYSITTNYGLNCFDPGDDPYNNNVFLIFTAAMIKVCKKYQSLLRLYSSSVSNDYRLGGLEAPPSIITVFLGSYLEELFNYIRDGKIFTDECKEKFKAYALGEISRDKSDRNRTSAMSFTGNKFEFRMLGSSKNASDVNICLNAAMAEVLTEIRDELLLFKDDAEKLRAKTLEVVAKIMKEYGDVLYSGDNYADAWKEEAKRRGLLDHKNYFEALIASRQLDLSKIFIKQGIFTENELRASFEIALNAIVNYKSLEAKILMDMLSKDIIPSLLAELKDIKEVLAFRDNKALSDIYYRVNEGIESLYDGYDCLKKSYDHAMEIDDLKDRAAYLQNDLHEKLLEIRNTADEMETLVSRKNLNLPSYEEMFNSLD